jgi:uncharacterized protein YbjT (DUF2867 family)
MDMLEGRIALVVGGAGAVGAAVCRELVRHGAQVLIADGCSRVAAGTKLAHELGPCARFELLDPHDETEWLATVNDGTGRFGGLDLVVLVEPDATGVALALRAAGPHLARRGGAFVGLACEQAAAALSRAGIPVVEVPDADLSDAALEALASVALRYVRSSLRASPRHAHQ